jgi:hypothetical protein
MTLFQYCSSCDTEDVIATVGAMCHQEESAYLKHDYLSQSPLIDAACRDKMVAWCFQVVDFLKLTHESVEISMSHLDRFLVTPQGAAALTDRNVFQLAAIASLYTAVKIHEAQAMDPALVSFLSRNTYSAKQVEDMEATILNALQWRVNPPTASSFARNFLQLIPSNVLNEKLQENVYSVAKAQIEISVVDYAYIGTSASVIAYCAVTDAIESLHYLDEQVLDYIKSMLVQSIGVEAVDEALFIEQEVLQQEQWQEQTASKATTEYQNTCITRRLSLEGSPRAAFSGRV